MKTTADAQQLDDLAATQVIVDAEVADCWPLVRAGLQTGAIGLDNLPRLIEHLRAGNGMTLDELTIEVCEDDPGRALVAMLDDEHRCGAPTLIESLERLRARAEGLRVTPGKPGLSGSGEATPDSAAPPVTATAADAPDLLAALAGFLGTSPARLAGDQEAYRAQVERVRAAAAAFAQAVNDPACDAAARAAAGARLQEVLAESARASAATAQERLADLPRTIAGLGIDASRLAPALRSIAAWIETPDTATGAAVDRAISEFDAALGPWLDRLGRGADAEKRDERVREAARASIAARLGKANREP